MATKIVSDGPGYTGDFFERTYDLLKALSAPSAGTVKIEQHTVDLLAFAGLVLIEQVAIKLNRALIKKIDKVDLQIFYMQHCTEAEDISKRKALENELEQLKAALYDAQRTPFNDPESAQFIKQNILGEKQTLLISNDGKAWLHWLEKKKPGY